MTNEQNDHVVVLYHSQVTVLDPCPVHRMFWLMEGAWSHGAT